MNLVIRLLVSALAIFISVYLLPGVHVDGGAETYLILTVVLAAINLFLKPILTLLTLPLSIITLGIFSLVLNALLVMLADRMVPGFAVDSFLWALAFGVVLAVVNSVLKRFED
jgi:putative membrane protein